MHTQIERALTTPLVRQLTRLRWDAFDERARLVSARMGTDRGRLTRRSIVITQFTYH